MDNDLDKTLPKQAIYQMSGERPLLIVSNRAPISMVENGSGAAELQRGNGGLVTALTGLARQVNLVWLACAQNPAEAGLDKRRIPLDNSSNIELEFINPEKNAYDGYYNVIANPLLWFLQHSMWNIPLVPVIDRSTWQAWRDGYVTINRLFAERVARVLQERSLPPLVMFQDYHLYLAPRFLEQLCPDNRPTMLHFIHIPWPGPEEWGFLPPAMREAILDGLCAVDLLGFQTREDGLNFIRTCDAYLPTASAAYKEGTVLYHNHTTHVREFPISVDVDDLRMRAGSPDVAVQREELMKTIQDHKLILRIDRIEPSKNIVRGFQAFAEMLECHPEHRGKVVFLALLVPSRLGVDQYKDYLDALMAAAGRVNAQYGDREWEPIRLLVGENYDRAIAALQLYDVLLVNSIADGMNLVAKEGPIVNGKDGTLILSDRAGAHEQLEPGAIIISPCDIYATAEALHQGLVMNVETRQIRASRLRWLIEKDDINAWLGAQLQTIEELSL
jgi:trehalose 6-phosphate synthase